MNTSIVQSRNMIMFPNPIMTLRSVPEVLYIFKKRRNRKNTGRTAYNANAVMANQKDVVNDVCKL